MTRRELDGRRSTSARRWGRRVRATADHPFVTAATASRRRNDLTTEDWLPLAQGASVSEAAPLRLDVLAGLVAAELEPEDVIVRVDRRELAAVGPAEMRRRLPEAGASRRSDIRRVGAMRLTKLDALGLPGDDRGSPGRRGTGRTSRRDRGRRAFWRVVGLYIAEGTARQTDLDAGSTGPSTRRDEHDLVAEVLRTGARRREGDVRAPNDVDDRRDLVARPRGLVARKPRPRRQLLQQRIPDSGLGRAGICTSERCCPACGAATARGRSSAAVRASSSSTARRVASSPTACCACSAISGSWRG